MTNSSFYALAVSVFLITSMSQGQVLMKEDFNNAKKGFAATILKHGQVNLAKGKGPDGSDAIRVAYVGYDRGSKRVVRRHALSKPATQATLSFDVQFDKDFKWVIGGKLNGLGPKNPITGGRERKPNGWSARANFKKDGRAATYLYDQNKDKKYGVGQTTAEPVFSAGKWHTVTLQVSLNDAGQKNRYAKLFIDGKQALDTQDIEFRGSDERETLIQNFLFSTFHGGSSPKYAPIDKNGKYTTVYALFDNVQVLEGIQPPSAK